MEEHKYTVPYVCQLGCSHTMPSHDNATVEGWSLYHLCCQQKTATPPDPETDESRVKADIQVAASCYSLTPMVEALLKGQTSAASWQLFAIVFYWIFHHQTSHLSIVLSLESWPLIACSELCKVCLWMWSSFAFEPTRCHMPTVRSSY